MSVFHGLVRRCRLRLVVRVRVRLWTALASRWGGGLMCFLQPRQDRLDELG